MPHGLTPSFDAPFSGQLKKEIIVKALGKLPQAIKEATAMWESIQESRSSGVAPIFDDGPLDDAVRDGTWRPELQVAMPIAGGLPKSRGMKQIWQHTKELAEVASDGNKSTVKNLIHIFEKRPQSKHHGAKRSKGTSPKRRRCSGKPRD